MTFISFPDITATSPDRKLRLKIRGKPEEGLSFCDQSDFTYEMFEVESSQLLWQWSPTAAESMADFPHEAWVHDAGFAVVRFHHWFGGGLLVLSPNPRMVMLRHLTSVGVEPGLLKDDDHTGWTSAGPSWHESSFGLSLAAGNRPYWSMRTWWGQRIVIDLAKGTVLDEVPEHLAATVLNAERKWVLRHLEQGVRELQEPDTEDDEWWPSVCRPARTAVYHAGSLQLKKAVPYLREMESCPVVNSWGSEMGLRCAHLDLRLVAKASLMRIGVEPQWLPNIELRDEEFDQKLEVRCPAENRSPDAIQVGMESFALLRTVGIPEMMRGRWDYWFFDDNQPLLVRVHFKTADGRESQYWNGDASKPLIVDSVEHLPGFPWETDRMVAYMLAH